MTPLQAHRREQGEARAEEAKAARELLRLAVRHWTREFPSAADLDAILALAERAWPDRSLIVRTIRITRRSLAGRA